MIGLVVMLVMVFASRMVNEKAMKKLSSEEKGLLVDGFASNRMWSLGLIILLITGYFLVVRFEVVNMLMGVVTYLVLLTVFIAVQFITSDRKLKELGLPEDYIRSFRISVLIRITGMVLFFLLSIAMYGW